jgi:hypothetical protein
MTAARLWLATLAAAVLMLVPPASPVLAQDAGVIEGQVTNGTAGAGPAADLEIVVYVLQNGQKTGERLVRSDGTGRFRVDGLATGPDMVYFPILEYQNIAYYPDRPVRFEGAPLAQSDIAIFETTPTPEALSFERLNMLVMSVSPTTLTIMEMGAVTNTSDRTFAADAAVTGSARTVRFALPPGATQVTPQAGLPADTLESIPDGFATTDPVRPGRREIAFSYLLPYDASNVDLTRTFALPVGTFTLLVPDEVGGVVASGMSLQGTAELGGRTFRQYVAERIESGSDVRFRLTGLPAPMFGRPRDLGLLVSGTGAALLLGFLGFTVRRRRSQRAAVAATNASPSAQPIAATPIGAERLALVEAIARLDEQFAAGELDDDTYDAARAEQKARLLDLAQPAAAAR